MIKRLQITLLALFVSVLAMASETSVKNADGVEIWYDFDSSAKTASVTYKGKYFSAFSDEYVGEVVIPSKVTYEGEEYSVTKIGSYAFYLCSSLTSITIPESVTEIGNEAFGGCGSLTSITIPEGVTEIGEWAFNGCSSLTSITIPEDVTWIGSSAFKGCSSLTSITIPEGVTTIGSSAFSGCSSLTSITIPEDVTWIGSSAFKGCSSLTSITIPEGVTEIGEWAFDYCYSLTSITLPESLTSIGDEAFFGCSSLTSITLPESVTKIGKSAFECCYSLASITIPEGVTSIGGEAFEGCSSLTSIDVASNNNSYTSINGVLFSKDKTILIKYPEGKKDVTSYAIPEGVTSIENYAFLGCSSLTSITIPESVKTIGEGAFLGCTSLTSIDVASNNNNYTSIDGVLFSKDKTILIKYPESKKDVTSYAIPESVTSIGKSAFECCYSLTSITIPESVTEIGSHAFSECYKLYEVYNKSNLAITAGSYINGEVAYYAKNVYTDDSGESKLHTVGDYIFYVDEDNIELLAYIGDEIAITLPSDYEGKDYIIAYSAFYGCSSLTSITIPKGVTEIGEWAFEGCSSLTSITIPESVKTIGEGAFLGCTSLTSIDVASNNNSYTSINGVLFSKDKTILIRFPWGKKDVTSYAIPESVTSIGSFAFEVCSTLTSITLPEGVTKIGEEAFYNCSGLTSITSMNITPPSMDDSYTFYKVDKSIPVYVPKQSVEAYMVAEYWKDFTNIQGIDDTPISDIQKSEINVRLIGNTIVVEGTDNYFVYSISGQCLGKVESLERGVYIVVADGVSKKIVVK